MLPFKNITFQEAMETIEFRDGTKFGKEVEDIQYGCCGVCSNPTVSTNNKTIMGYYRKCGTCHLCEDAYKAYLESGIYEPIRCTAMHDEMNIKIPINFPSMTHIENDNIKENVSTLLKWKIY